MKAFTSLTLALAAEASYRKVIATSEAPGAIGPYSQGIAVEDRFGNGMIYAAGQIGIVPATGKLIEGGITPEATQVMANIKAILNAGNANMDNIVECTVLMLDFDDYDAFNAVYGKSFNDLTAPARAAFQVVKLPLGARVEVKCSAVTSWSPEANLILQ